MTGNKILKAQCKRFVSVLHRMLGVSKLKLSQIVTTLFIFVVIIRILPLSKKPSQFSQCHALAMPPKTASKKSKPTSSDDNNITIIQSQCHCQKVLLDIEIPAITNTTKVWNCHCLSCRKYHTTAYVGYLTVGPNQVSIRRGHDKIGKVPSSCTVIGPNVERWYCQDCSSKLLSCSSGDTVQSKEMDTDESAISTCYNVNLGPLKESNIPTRYFNSWKDRLKLKSNNLPLEEKCTWVDALPTGRMPTGGKPRTKWTGGCACGACQYEIDLRFQTELQHCYCHLCRELSGGPFMTWMPISKRYFQWIKGGKRDSSSSFAQLVRTTPFGSRHICTNCRGVLTIVYDGQPTYVWPCAGGLDDSTLPSSTEEMGNYLCRVCHICCRHHPRWMHVKKDGMEQIADAC